MFDSRTKPLAHCFVLRAPSKFVRSFFDPLRHGSAGHREVIRRFSFILLTTYRFAFLSENSPSSLLGQNESKGQSGELCCNVEWWFTMSEDHLWTRLFSCGPSSMLQMPSGRSKSAGTHDWKNCWKKAVPTLRPRQRTSWSASIQNPCVRRS